MVTQLPSPNPDLLQPITAHHSPRHAQHPTRKITDKAYFVEFRLRLAEVISKVAELRRSLLGIFGQLLRENSVISPSGTSFVILIEFQN